MDVAHRRGLPVTRGRGLVVPPHHLFPFGRESLQQQGHHGLQRHLQEPQEGPRGPGVDGNLRRLFLGDQGPGVQGQALHPPGQFLDPGRVVNDDAVRRQFFLMEGDGLLVQSHQQVHPLPGGGQGPVRHPDAVAQVAAPDAGLVVHGEQDMAPLAHQDLGQRPGNGVHPLPCGSADQDV
jgi:hypothetical protein